MKKRTKIANITTDGAELAVDDLKMIAGGMQGRWENSTCIKNPGEIDTCKDWVND